MYNKLVITHEHIHTHIIYSKYAVRKAGMKFDILNLVTCNLTVL